MFDVIIAGLGAMGSAAAYHLSKAGLRVLGLDPFSPPHTFGSSHGRTRIIREAYFEHPAYVPLVQRAYTLWHELAADSRRKIISELGGLMAGRPESQVVAGARQSAEQHRLAHEILSPAEVSRRFPALRLAEDMIGVWEPRAGVLFPESCIQAHLKMAKRFGAELRFGVALEGWSALKEGVGVITLRGRHWARWLIMAAGSWMPELVPPLARPLRVERQVQFWFKPSAPALFAPKACPIHIFEHEPGRYFYGFPDLADGVKVARHHEGATTRPEQLDCTVHPEEIDSMRALLRRFVPAADGPLLESSVCMYTNTPDRHFLVDHHPEHPQVLMVSACSGHGFKFSSAIGEMLARWIVGGKHPEELSFFRWRFNGQGAIPPQNP